MLRNVTLYNTPFDGVYELDVVGPAEAIRALRHTLKGFNEYLKKNTLTKYKVLVGGSEIAEDEFQYPDNNDIEIYQLVEGSGNVGKIILGGALIYFSAGMASGAAIGSFAASAASALSSIGYSLVLGGVSGLLFKPPKLNTPEKGKADLNFNGVVNTTEQGNSLPLAYGELVVGSQVVSMGFTVEKIED
jgi:predicted phage tail protein